MGRAAGEEGLRARLAEATAGEARGGPDPPEPEAEHPERVPRHAQGAEEILEQRMRVPDEGAEQPLVRGPVHA